MEREKLIKGLIYIAIIIVLTTVASKLLFRSGETLQDYAQNNPDVAYIEPKDEEASLSEASDSQIEKEDSATKASSESVSSNHTNVSRNDITDAEVISPDRVTYQENFYYEPLNDELRTFITGTSFPPLEVETSQYEASARSEEDPAAFPDGPVEISYEDLRYVHVLHYDFEGEIKEGELICNTVIAQDLLEIFYELFKAEYQIEKIRLIDEYGGDDELSMEDNNTSCFNYRVVEGSDKLSKHAYGLAIDVNPFYNPYVRYNKDGSLHIDPKGSDTYADRSASFPYKIDENDLCLKLFKEHGFAWGGDWNSMKDYQHFQKVVEVE